MVSLAILRYLEKIRFAQKSLTCTELTMNLTQYFTVLQFLHSFHSHKINTKIPHKAYFHGRLISDSGFMEWIVRYENAQSKLCQYDITSLNVG